VFRQIRRSSARWVQQFKPRIIYQEKRTDECAGNIHAGQGLSADLFSLNVLTGLVPAFLLAGALAVFVSQALVLKYLGAKTNKFVSYSIATVAGIVLSVCSCTAIPLFAGIRKRGAGLGPAIAFLCAAPALDILPIIYTFR